MTIEVVNEVAMKALGKKLGALLKGGEIIELVGDVGAGKTTLVKGVATGLLIDEDIQSPSFTISRVYNARDGLTLAHYDFYRLHDAGIMADELHETVHDVKTITIIEWADVVDGVLPENRITIHITSPSEELRSLEMHAKDKENQALLEKLA
ncbi:MAG TPA: tRNA (adenosine(37)-N6)-threonylcarbamoyltransferase complex ATPase subunit type 1 TsaE [Candidatus Saccharimonadales bacterium]|nr:tRNA (adenosine(37)-N6)-threonylcarbamoyltransferase complex ATPase subunit type 1 TsaE [Candidatus Saccharimonadales bacterium]